MCRNLQPTASSQSCMLFHWKGHHDQVSTNSLWLWIDSSKFSMLSPSVVSRFQSWIRIWYRLGRSQQKVKLPSARARRRRKPKFRRWCQGEISTIFDDVFARRRRKFGWFESGFAVDFALENVFSESETTKFSPAAPEHFLNTHSDWDIHRWFVHREFDNINHDCFYLNHIIYIHSAKTSKRTIDNGLTFTLFVGKRAISWQTVWL